MLCANMQCEFCPTSTSVLRFFRLCMLHMWINIKWQYAMWIYSISTMSSWFIRIYNILKCHVSIYNVKLTSITFVFGNVLMENKIESMYLIIVNWCYVTVCNVKLFNIHFAFVNHVMFQFAMWTRSVSPCLRGMWSYPVSGFVNSQRRWKLVVNFWQRSKLRFPFNQ